MFKVLKNLKKTWTSVIAIVILLCVQAWADLELPNYTSKIVNTGIQAGGIENVAPQIIRKSQMETIMMFTNDDEKILSYYELNTNNLSTEGKKKINKYLGKDTNIEENTIYVLKNINKNDKSNLDEIITKPLMIAYTITDEKTQMELKKQIIENMQNEPNLPKDIKMAFEQMGMIDILKQMPEENKNKIIEQISASLDEKLGNMASQVAVNITKLEYKQLGINTDKIQNEYIIITGIQMLGIALISMISAITIMFLSSKVASRLGRTLREKVFKKVLSFTEEEFRNFSTASLITRSTNDIQQIQMLISMLFRVVVYAPIIGVGGFIRVLTNSNTSMAWIIGLAILLVIGIVLILFIIAMPKFKKLQTLIDKLNLVSREILTGLPVIRAFSTAPREEKRFDSANQDLMRTNIFVNRAMSIMMPALMLIMNGIMLLIIWVGGHGVEDGIMQVGDMMAFMQYTMQIIMSFLMISMISIMLPRASVSANRINEVLETIPKIKDLENVKKFDEKVKGLVEFKDVSFRYPDADQEMLTDVNFKAEPGKTTAIIGSTGSGKSTIVNLIPRFYDVTGGEILINGINIKEVSVKELRSKIGFVPQKGVLFSGTIESNIKYSNSTMSNEQMENAARIAQATEFIEQKDKKYKSEISQGRKQCFRRTKTKIINSKSNSQGPRNIYI